MSTTTDRWLLPAGIGEVLPPQAVQLEQLRRRLLDLFASWGYDLVIPPFIEYLESLLTGTGHDLDLSTFKLTDQLTGRTMGVRADMTPQVARIDAHCLNRKGPVRLCYAGTVLHTRPDGFAGSRSPLQVGAELYGHAGVESDVEVLTLMLRTLAAARIDGVHMDLGHVGIFRGLARQAGLDTEQETALLDMLQRKAATEIAAFLQEPDIPADSVTMLDALIGLNGDVRVLGQARRTLARAAPDVHASLDELEQVASRIQQQFPDLPIYFDLAELRGYHYHTGVVFAAFVPGQGQEVARGGRYDDIGAVFGRARPATGFSADLKTLLSLAAHGDADHAQAIFAPASADPALAARVQELRAHGTRVVVELAGQGVSASELGCSHVLTNEKGKWVMKPV